MRRIMVDFGKCLGCHTCELACAASHSDSGTFIGAVVAGERPSVTIHVTPGKGVQFPLQCRHCTDAPCSKACPVGALQRDEASGGIVCIKDKCLGCMMCAIVCPFGAITESSGDHKASKCDLCLDREEMPSCVSSCPTGALSFIEVDEFSAERRGDFVFEYEESEV